MSKSEIATSFLKLAVSGKIREAYDKYVSQNFKHHNPYFKGDRESLMSAMEENANPNRTFEIKQILKDKDLIMTLSHVIHKPEELGGAVVHIFRFEGNKIVEMWDTCQEIPKDSPNENGMF